MIKEYQKKDGSVILSENFKVREFACKCSRCSQLLLDEALVELLQRLRDHFGVSVHINSGYRCKEHNAEVGGSSSSHHMKGMAADIRVEGIAPKEVAKYAESIGIKRIGLYDNFVHIGSGATKRFWLGHEGTNVDTFGGAEKTVAVSLPVFKKGAKGGAVWGLQALLRGYGHDLGEKGLDGSFGTATENAVRKFQHENDLEVDGSVGRATWNELLGI